jgi:hypothetical protein
MVIYQKVMITFLMIDAGDMNNRSHDFMNFYLMFGIMVNTTHTFFLFTINQFNGLCHFYFGDQIVESQSISLSHVRITYSNVRFLARSQVGI